MILDTCCLVDLERRKPEALSFLESIPDERLAVTTITLGELLCGEVSVDSVIRGLARFEMLEVTPESALHYGSAFRALKRSGSMIGSNDLWIASIALANKLPVVTRNAEEFSRVPGLRVVKY